MSSDVVLLTLGLLIGAVGCASLHAALSLFGRHRPPQH